MIAFLVYLLIILVVLGAVYWIGTIILGMIGAPPPLQQVFHIAFVVICVILLLYFLLHLLPVGAGHWGAFP